MKVTIVQSMELSEELRTKLAAGTSVSLRPEPGNKVDSNAVAVYLDNDKVGYMANSPSTVRRGTTSATKMSGFFKDGVVASCTAVLESSYEHECARQEGKKQTHWIALTYPVPVWNKDEGNIDEPIVLDVTAKSRVQYSDNGQVLDNFSSFGPGDLIVKLDTSANGEVKPIIMRRAVMASRFPAPAGEVKNPPDKLMLALQTKPMLPVSPVKVTGRNSFQVSLQVDGIRLDEFFDDMTSVIERHIMQAKDVKERFNYLVEQGVPASIIHGVTRSMRVLENPGLVSKPTQLFIQSGDRDYLTRALGYHLAGKNVRLVGEKGAGKNTLISSICWVLNQPLCRLQGNSDMDKIDILGGQTLNDHGTKFELSTFITTLMNGGDVVLDEINAIKPEIAIILQSLLDDAKCIEVPGYGTVKVHPASRIWATMNEAYVGTGEMNAATADRFTPIIMEDTAGLSALLRNRFPNAKEDDISACNKIYNQIRQAAQDQRCSYDAVTIRGFIDAMECSMWLPLRDTLLDNIAGRPQDPEDRKVVEAFINAVYPA